MLNVLVNGTLHDAPERLTSKNGCDFATAKLIVPTADGGVWTKVIAFDAQTVTALMGLSAGDSLSAVGTLMLGPYISKSGESKLSAGLVADGILTAYQVGKRRRRAQEAEV